MMPQTEKLISKKLKSCRTSKPALFLKYIRMQGHFVLIFLIDCAVKSFLKSPRRHRVVLSKVSV